MNTGTVDYQEVFRLVPQLPQATVTLICLLLFVGAAGKSAQFPLHVWLPDAMEGPTPVSALIHAATMVTAGVYMVARCNALFSASPTAMQVVAVVGTLTAVMAAAIALTQTDLKRIMAYSTVSQLGFMFLGLGVGAWAGAIFHLFTHAFFKALLFLGSGSVMHAIGGDCDITRQGRLARHIPWTTTTFIVGSLALAGIFPFAGFFSKEMILGGGLRRAPLRALRLRGARRRRHGLLRHPGGRTRSSSGGATPTCCRRRPPARAVTTRTGTQGTAATATAPARTSRRG